MHLHLQVETEILKGVAGLLLLSALNAYLTPHFLVANLGDISVFRYLSWIHHAISQDNAELQSTFWAVPVSGFDQIQSHGPSEVFSQRPEKGHELHDFSPAKPGDLERSRCSLAGGLKHLWIFMVF